MKSDDVNKELEQELFQVIEALNRLSMGDPDVKIAEDSKFEIIVEIKRLINQNAKTLKYIVDLSHEFAIGLAEHFDVLQRVSQGDLAARISGDSKEEFLGYLKNTTNQMIESIVQEITNRSQAEDKLQETIDHLENVLDNSAETIGIVDKNGKFIKWNKIAAEVYGYSFEEIKGKSYFDLYADQDKLEKMLVQLRSDGFIREYEIDMKKKDGMIFPCSVSISILRDKNNENIGSVCVARDLSVQKRFEEERLQHEKLQGILEIAGAVCHEMNQPFMAISGYTELLLMDMPDDNVFKEKIVKINEQVDRMAGITQKLMKISRYETKEYLKSKIIDIDKAAE